MFRLITPNFIVTDMTRIALTLKSILNTFTYFLYQNQNHFFKSSKSMTHKELRWTFIRDAISVVSHKIPYSVHAHSMLS